jgi:hypothetical protein
MQSVVVNSTMTGDVEGEARAQGYKAMGRAQMALIDNADKLGEKERVIASLLLDQQEVLSENLNLRA